MTGIRIVTDSACDLDDDVVRAHGVEIVPLTIRFGDNEYTDRFELSADEFYEKMAASSALPETAAPSPGQFEETFTRLGDEGASTVICINLSSDLSATMASAQNAARSLEGKLDVRVVDSKSITGGLGTQVLEAAKAAEAGKDADDIIAMVEGLRSRTRMIGALDTLDNLKKGGRIGGAQALLGSMLSIKPIIDISTGKVEKASQQRTRRRALEWIRDRLFEEGHVEHLVVCSGNAPDAGDFRAMLLERYQPDEVSQVTIGAVIGAHGGPRVLGATWITPA